MPIESMREADGRYYPSELRQSEEAMVEARRIAAGANATNQTVAVACSGGGIRSATTCLGFFQALAEHDFLPRVDYMATVSGGGYFGSFLGALIARWRPGGSSARPVDIAKEALCNYNSAPIRWLRENGRYIAPKGTSDYANIVGIYVRNWLGLHFVIGTTMLTLSLLLLFGATRLAERLPANILGLSAPYPLPHEMHVEPSPFLIGPIVVAVFGLLPLFWAFWLSQHNIKKPTLPAIFIANYPFYTSILVIAALTAAASSGLAGESAALCWVAVVVGALAIVYWLVCEIMERNAAGVAATAAVTTPMVRNDLSNAMTTCVVWFATTVALVAIDLVARTLYSGAQTLSVPTAIYGAVAAVASAVYKLAPLLAKGRATRAMLSQSTIASCVGFALLFFVAVGWYVVALWVTDVGGPQFGIYSPEIGVDFALPSVYLFAAALLIVTLLTGQTLAFINLSSLQLFYGARLRRAYLGASNGHRISQFTGEISDDVAINREVPDDDISWSKYRPDLNGGPLHLIAMTVNSTTHGASQLEMQDRKGVLMTVGPAGISVGPAGHALWLTEQQETRLKPLARGEETAFKMVADQAPCEGFTLSRLMAISGAAFSTGLGARTRTGMSVLLGSANIRLGYWWDSSSKEWEKSTLKLWAKRLFRTQTYLYQEFLGHFPGYRQQHWYLSDGGHAENTGAYELIRRRVSRIVILDNGADPNYQFEDFANLVRRVRIDFGAQVEAIDLEQAKGLSLLTFRDPATHQVGGLDRVARKPATAGKMSLSQSCFSLFHVVYPDKKAPSLVILAKPTLLGDEPADVIEYAQSHPAFPQEPTSDQFFDEAQWESYRRVGYALGCRFVQSLQI